MAGLPVISGGTPLQQAALDAKAPLASPALTGTPTINGVAAETVTGSQAKATAAQATAIAAAAVDASAKVAAVGTPEPAFSRWTGLGATVNVKVDPTLAVTAPLAAGALAIATGIGTGDDIVEPKVLFDATAPFLGFEYVLCAAPYYQSNALYENPTLWVSHDGTTWVPVVNGVPTVGGTPTALVLNASQGDGNLSDPEIVRGPDGTYYVVYDQVLVATGSGGTGTGGHDWAVKGISAPSLAGPWSAPVTLFATTTGLDRPSTPALIWDGHQWVMYAVDAHNTSATTISRYTSPSASPLAATWTKQASPAISLPAPYNATRVWWHLNAYRLGTQHLLVIQDNLAGSSSSGNLWLVVSNDGGTTWTVPATPMLATTLAYRSAIVPMITPTGLVLDLFYGVLSGTWQLRRTTVSYAPAAAVVPIYGGVSASGLPYNAMATAAAKTPIKPYVFGDTAIRADSATAIGTSDSGALWVVSGGVMGISGNQIYVVSGANPKAGIVLAGAADGVFSVEQSVVDSSGQSYVIARWADASNYIRFGWGGAGWILQNIVAGGVNASGVVTYQTLPANGDVLSILCKGSAVTAYVNGLVAATATFATGAANSGIGLQSALTTVRWRNLSLRALVGGI